MFVLIVVQILAKQIFPDMSWLTSLAAKCTNDLDDFSIKNVVDIIEKSVLIRWCNG